jgi:GNAT superfamily N-acetyltransferase
MQLKQLSECPEHLDAVGTWIYEQWWRKPDNTPEVVLSRLRQHTQRDAVPFTIVALENGQPVGSCCVIENDCVHRPQCAPWVAAVFVKEQWRHRGIASRILQEACRVARRAGVKDLYIDCHVNTVPLYEQNGWTILEREVGDAVSVVMLRMA